MKKCAPSSAALFPRAGLDQCILYGAGNLGKALAERLPKMGILPVGFLDRKKTGECAGLPIATPENAPTDTPAPYIPNSTVIITRACPDA